MAKVEGEKVVQQIGTDGAKPDVMYKGTYQFVVQAGKARGMVRSGTVACVASDVDDARVKMTELVKNYGHGEFRFTSISKWS